MNQNTQFIPPKNAQISPPNYFPPKKHFYFNFLLWLIFLLVLIFLIFTILRQETLTTQISNKIVPHPSENLSITSSMVPSSNNLISPSSSKTEVSNPFIIYLRDGNIWIVKKDGTSLRQITRDADNQNISYTLPFFKTEKEITFARCLNIQHECIIKSKDLETSIEKIELEPKLYVNNLSWDKSGKLLAYIAANQEGNSSLYFYENGNNKKVLDFAYTSERGSGLNDEASLKFSPEGKYLLVVNTLTQPNNNDPTTLWLIDRNGNLIIKNEATNAIWESNTVFLYKKGESLYKNNLFGQEEKLTEIKGLNFTLSPDKKKLIYWDIDSLGITTVSFYDLNTKINQEIKKDLSYPQWVNNQEIVAIKTISNPDSYLGFSTNGLVVFNLETKEEHLLDSSSSISQFLLEY